MMKISLLTYLRRDRSRLIALFLMSLLIITTAKFTIPDFDRQGFLIIILIIACLFLINVLHSAFLKGRAFQDEKKNYLLVNMWERNIKGKCSVLYALLILLLVQFQIFYCCVLIILWFSCLFYHFEYHVNGNVHNFFDALYAIIISGTTIGFGDITPITYFGKILAVLSSFIGVLIFGLITASCCQAIQSTFFIFRNRTKLKKDNEKN